MQSLGSPRREGFGPGFVPASLLSFLKSSKAVKSSRRARVKRKVPLPLHLPELGFGLLPTLLAFSV